MTEQLCFSSINWNTKNVNLSWRAARHSKIGFTYFIVCIYECVRYINIILFPAFYSAFSYSLGYSVPQNLITFKICKYSFNCYMYGVLVCNTGFTFICFQFMGWIGNQNYDVLKIMTFSIPKFSFIKTQEKIVLHGMHK